MLIRICRSWNGEFKFPNLLYYRYKRYLKVPQITILMGISLLELLWPKMIISGRKIQLNQKKLRYLLIKLRILDHKSSNMQMSNQIFLWVTFKKKSRFGNWNSPFLYQKILSNIVVFLAFMVLKVKKRYHPNAECKLLAIWWKNSENPKFSVPGLPCDLQKNFWPFSIFLRYLLPKKSSGMQKSCIYAKFHSKQY